MRNGGDGGAAEQGGERVSHDIERAIFQASERSFQGLLIASLDTLELIYVNQTLMEMLGLTQESLKGQDLAAFFEAVHPDDRAVVDEGLKRRRAGDERPAKYTVRVAKPDGDSATLNIHTGFVMLDSGPAMLAVIQDLTDTMLKQAELEVSATRHRSLFEHMNDACFLAEAESGTLIDANPAAERLLGLPRERIIGMHHLQLHPAEDEQTYQAMFRKHAEQGAALEEAEVQRSDGARVPVRISTATLELAGRTYLLGLFHDVSALKQAAHERQRLEERMLQAQKLESLGVLAGGIAHDFNNLLMGVLGNAELARLHQQTGASAVEPIERIRLAALQAADLAKQLLAYSGRGRFEVLVQGLNDLVEDLKPLLITSIGSRAELEWSPGVDLPAVELDGTQIRQLLMNLVINAADAVGDGPGHIRVSTGLERCDRACLSETYLDDDLPEGDYVWLEVRDDGCGMDDQTLKRIFDPFFTTKFTGRGLGLAAVVGIVRGHRGALSVDSRPGQGSAFRVLLPVVETARAVRSETDQRPIDFRGSGWVLVVDDATGARQVAQAMLERLGFSVEAVGDGSSGLDAFRARPDGFRLVLLDMTMPGLSGVDVLAELRRLRPDAKVVLTSGYHQGEVIDRTTAHAPDAFLQKPYVFQSLIDVLERVLGD